MKGEGGGGRKYAGRRGEEGKEKGEIQGGGGRKDVEEEGKEKEEVQEKVEEEDKEGMKIRAGLRKHQYIL